MGRVIYHIKVLSVVIRTTCKDFEKILLRRLIKSSERSEDSYISPADFFSRKSLKMAMLVGIMHFLSSIEIYLLKLT